MHRKERYLNLLFIRAAVSDVCKIYCDGFKFWPENEWPQNIYFEWEYMYVCLYHLCMGEAIVQMNIMYVKIISPHLFYVRYGTHLHVCIYHWLWEKLSDILLVSSYFSFCIYNSTTSRIYEADITMLSKKTLLFFFFSLRKSQRMYS